MKTRLQLALICATLLFFFNESKAQTKLIHYWHFNNVASGVHLGTGKLNSDYTKQGVTTGYLRNVKLAATVRDTGYWDNGTPGDTTNQRPGFGGCCGGTTSAYIRTRNPNDSMQFLWYIPTTHFKNIVIKYSSQSSSAASGPARQKYEYSLDSGATFITTGLPILFDSAGVAFGKVTLNLSALTTVNNTNKLMLRIRTSAPNTGTSGNTRYDNITVEGDSISAVLPTGIAQLSSEASGFSVYPNPSNDYIFIGATGTAPLQVTIADITGRVVYATNSYDKSPVDVSHLTSGIYFVHLNDSAASRTAVLKFVKN